MSRKAQVTPVSVAGAAAAASTSESKAFRPVISVEGEKSATRSPTATGRQVIGAQRPGAQKAPQKGATGKEGRVAKPRKPLHPLARFGNKVLESAPVTVVMMLATFWTLIADDIRIAADVPMEFDQKFTIVTSVCFFLFGCEVLLALAVKRGYPRSAYFAFDVIATATLVTEMPWIIDNIAGEGGRGQTASEASSAARTVRLLRVVRLIRLVRLVKLYKLAMERLFPKEKDGKVREHSETPSWQDNPSAVGRALQESITLQVVVGVLLMLIVFPLISVSEARIAFEYDLEVVQQLDQLWRAHTAGSASAGVAARTLIANAAEFQSLVYFVTYDGTELLVNDAFRPPNVRDVEYSYASAGVSCSAGGGDSCSHGGFYKRTELILQAQYSLALLAFVIVLLISGVLIFSRIATRYCIAPIEKLFALVNAFAKDPMAKLDSFGDDSLEELNELEQSIRKIASLLQVGIGLAGRETIARCLRTTGEINPIAVGLKVNCLFGFCDIRQFTDATECLQEQVMLFTNSVGHIVHHAVHDCGGFANKNIGDAFLVAWTGEQLERRIAQVEHVERNKAIGALFTENDIELAARHKWTPTVGDKAMASFIRLTIVVRGATALTELVQNPTLQKRLPGFTVRLGCGLHVGWAIEGALGTQKKIDATYLSPATNIAMALEGATKQYGNLLLISQETYKLFSPFVRQLVRRIDRVYVTAGTEPFDLYTYDLPTTLAVHPDEVKEKALLEHCFDYPLAITPEFRVLFAQALELYLQGKWVEAKSQFEAANELLVSQAKADKNLDAPDKPTLALLKLMAASDYRAPADWAGCRELE